VHLGWTLVLDGLYPLQRLVDRRFVWQKGVGNVEAALLFRPNSRHAIQRTLIATVVGPAGTRFQARDVSLPHGVCVFPQREHGQLLNVKTQADPKVAGCVMQDG